MSYKSLLIDNCYSICCSFIQHISQEIILSIIIKIAIDKFWPKSNYTCVYTLLLTIEILLWCVTKKDIILSIPWKTYWMSSQPFAEHILSRLFQDRMFEYFFSATSDMKFNPMYRPEAIVTRVWQPLNGTLQVWVLAKYL